MNANPAAPQFPEQTQATDKTPKFALGDAVSFIDDHTATGKISRVDYKTRTYLITLDSNGTSFWTQEIGIIPLQGQPPSLKSGPTKEESGECPLCKSGGPPVYKCHHENCNAHFHLKELLTKHELCDTHSCSGSCELCKKLSMRRQAPSNEALPQQQPNQQQAKLMDDVATIVISPEIKQKFTFDCEKISAGVVIPIPKSITCNTILTRYRDQLTEEQCAEFGVTREHANDILLGIEDTFNVALPRTLLYKNERTQWRQYIVQNEEENRVLTKKPSLVFGAEHLARLLITLPNLLIEAHVQKEKWNPIIMITNDVLSFINANLATFWTDGYSEIAPY